MDNFTCAAKTGGSTLDGTTFTGTTAFPGATTINSSGDIGVGTVSPTDPITVQGGSNQTVSINSANTNDIFGYRLNGSVSGGNGRDWRMEQGRSGAGNFDLTDCSTTSGCQSRLSINSAGDIALQSGSSGAATLSVYNYDTGTNDGIIVRRDGILGSLIRFSYSGTSVGAITTSGTSTSYNTTSDARLKNINVDQKNYKTIIRSLWVGDFRWKKNQTPGFGIIAQQAYSYFPQAIHKPSGESEYWQADYSKLAPLALWGVKDLYKSLDKQSDASEKQANNIDIMKQKMASEDAEITRLEKHLAILERRLDGKLASN